MMPPGWILDIFAALMLVVAAGSAARLAVARPWRLPAGDTDITVAHLLMAIAMAGMLTPSLSTLPNDVWDVIFAVMTAWFAWGVYHEGRGQGARMLLDGHRVPHLVHSAAMLYMFVAITTPAAGSRSGTGAMGGSSGAAMQTLRLPAIAFIFALWLAAYVVLDLDRLSGPAGHGSYFASVAAGAAGPALAVASAAGGSLKMAVAAPAPAVSEGGPIAAQPPDDGGAWPVRDSGGPAGSPLDASRNLLLSPRLAAGCRIAMGVTMALMLIIMI